MSGHAQYRRPGRTAGADRRERAATRELTAHGFLIVIEPDPDPDLSWLEQPEFAHEDKDDHELAGITVCPLAAGGAEPASIGFGASLWGIDYIISQGGAPIGRWYVAGPKDIPSELDAYSREVIRELFAELGL